MTTTTKKPAPKPTVAPADAQAGQGQPRPPVDHDETDAPRPTTLPRIKVQATQVCYYDDKRRRVGDVFTISGELWPEGHPRAGQPREFSGRYMEIVPASTPERITTGAQVLKQEHDQIAIGKRLDAHPELGARPHDKGIDDDDPAA